MAKRKLTLLPDFIPTDGDMRHYYDNGFGFAIYKSKGVIWVRATINLKEGRIVEYLRNIDVKSGIFKLLSRQVDSSVSTMEVVRRHNKYKLGSLVRMKVNEKSTLHTP